MPGSGGVRRAIRQSLLRTEGSVRTGRFRGLRISGFLLGVSAVLSVLLVAWLGAADVADVVALRLLAYAAWLYGLVGLPALLGENVQHGSAEGLARLRGLRGSNTNRRIVGLGSRLFFGLSVAALPGLTMAVALSGSFHHLGRGIALLVFSTAYLACLAACLAAVGVLSERLSPKHPRLLSLSIIMLPFLLGHVLPGTPSIPGAFIAAFDALVAWGSIG